MSYFDIDFARTLAEEHMAREVRATISTPTRTDDGMGGSRTGTPTSVTIAARLEDNGGSQSIADGQLRIIGRYLLHVPVAVIIARDSTVTISGITYRVVTLSPIDDLAATRPVGITELA